MREAVARFARCASGCVAVLALMVLVGCGGGEDDPTVQSFSNPQADGAAVVIVVSPRLWAELGQPKALRFVRAASLGVVSDQEATAAIAATERLKRMENGIDIGALASIETSETSSAQLLAFARRFDIDVNAINRSGGAIARGHPLAASGAVLAVRLFTDLVRSPMAGVTGGARGLATLSAVGGLGTAALFEAT